MDLKGTLVSNFITRSIIFARAHLMRDGYEIKHYRIKETGFNPIKPFLFLQPEGKNMST